MKPVLAKFRKWLLERSLWQVTAVYLIAAWAALGHVDLLTDRFGIADWVFDAALAAALVGLLAVLLTAAAWKRQVPISRLVWVALGYLAAWWILLEALGLLWDRGILPGPGAMRLAIVAAIGSLPIVLLIALFRFSGSASGD